MKREKKKRQQSAEDRLMKELAAKQRRREIAQEILGDEMAEDPAEVQRLFRGNRRDAPWNPSKKRT